MSSPITPDPGLLATLREALDSSYDIEREIGAGMSRVFVATERALGRQVVIKVLPPELTAGVNRDRFRREIQFAARLQHPHIVPLLTAGQVGDILYYTMPLIEGETLRSRLDREGSLSPSQVMAILQDVVDALAYAHGQGLVHRDIKPENILIQRHHALVTDFGVAKAIREAMPGTAATTIGIAVGTPAYMAPEQLAADPSADHRMDLYAVGLLGYELLSGGSPFSGSSPQQTLARQMTERPTPPHLQRPDVPSDLSAAIMRCLEKVPEARWASADELLQALGRIRITSSGIRAVSHSFGFERMSPARRRLIVGSTLVLLLAAGLSLYSILGGHRNAQPEPEGAQGAEPSAGEDSAAAADSIGGGGGERPSVLTRADSEAIAIAFARRMVAPTGPTLRMPNLDSIRVFLERGVADSVLKALALARRQSPLPRAGTSPRAPGSEISREIAPPSLRGTGALGGGGGGGSGGIVVLEITDVSRERDLGEVASTLTDSLAKALRSQGRTLVLSGARIDQLERELGNDQLLGMSLGARAVLRGSLAARRDSLSLFLAVFDTREQRYIRTLRIQAPRSAPAGLVDGALAQILEWLNRLPPSRRGAGEGKAPGLPSQ